MADDNVTDMSVNMVQSYYLFFLHTKMYMLPFRIFYK